jgi:hypothetical protein
MRFSEQIVEWLLELVCMSCCFASGSDFINLSMTLHTPFLIVIVVNDMILPMTIPLSELSVETLTRRETS